jgi:hypothetical protein
VIAAPILSAAGALGLVMQGAGQTYVALPNDVPETWTVEYPSLIQPFVDDYRRCLNIENRIFRGTAEFEEQHRRDVPRCETVSRKAQGAANDILARRGEAAAFTPEDVAQTFDHVGRIHIARGADLDNQFRSRIEAAAAAQADHERTRPSGLVLELRGAEELTALTHARVGTGKDAVNTKGHNAQD